MKRTIRIIGVLSLFCSLMACELDNYDRPAASIHGVFLDKDTGEPIEQDIVRGTQIEYQEGKFTATQYMAVKPDGSYRNNLMFLGEYRITPVRGNFEPLDTEVVKISGDTQLDFHVIPYLRIRNVSIFKNGDKVKALFKIQQTGYDKVSKIGLYAGLDQAAGATVNQSSVEIPIGDNVTDDVYYTIEMDITRNTGLKSGRTYYFRVGALIDAPEAKFNYAPAVELSL